MEATATHYKIEVEHDTLRQGTTILNWHGYPMAKIVPLDNDSLSDENQAHNGHSLTPDSFLRDIAAFKRMLPKLKANYNGQYVAIYNEQVVASGDERLALLDVVYEQFGPVPCFIEKVSDDGPRRVRMPLRMKVVQ